VLLVRNVQLGALTAGADEQFAERVRAVLERHWPFQCAELGEAGVLVSIRDTIVEARRFGIETERDVLRYLNARYALGESPAAVPELRAILERPTLGASFRVDRMTARVLRLLKQRSARRP
jgi:hypothetical protein